MIPKVLTLTLAIDYIMLNNLNIFVLLLNLIKDENTFKGEKRLSRFRYDSRSSLLQEFSLGVGGGLVFILNILIC